MKYNAYDVAVIGAGPAGMMAAGRACELGAYVILIEKLRIPGKKLLITGKGRCNITNDSDVAEHIKNIPRNPRFLYSALSNFDSADVISFFEERGVPLKTERGRRVFPVSDKASDIAGVLSDYCSGADRLISKVNSLIVKDGRIVGIHCDKGDIMASAVILASGGASYPLTGSTGDGYSMASVCGHTVIPVSPSLVPLISGDSICREAMGCSLKNVKVCFYENNELCFSELGELMFTHFGITGPSVLSGSAHFKSFDSKKSVVIDLKPALDDKKLDARILREISESPNRDMGNLVRSLLPSSLVHPILRRAGIPITEKANSLSREDRQKLISALKSLSIDITGVRPISEAIITRGGISTDEIDPKTMESRLVKGLYFAGEVIDTDAYTGGFNLQIALSTGRSAGQAAALK